jgi:molybdenum-dependent DNA-binding transcriptional regulator ModE
MTTKTGRLDARHIGVIAQEVEKVLPELVVEDKDGRKNMAYGNLTAVLVEAVKEQGEQIDDLKERIKKLEDE